MLFNKSWMAALALAALPASAFAQNIVTAMGAPGTGGGGGGTGTGGTCTATLMIDKTCDATVRAGSTFRCKIHVANMGDCDFSWVKVIDYLPQHADYVEASPLPKTVGHQLHWQGTLKAGEAGDLMIKLRANSSYYGWLQNRACAWATGLGFSLNVCDDAWTWVERPVAAPAGTPDAADQPLETPANPLE